MSIDFTGTGMVYTTYSSYSREANRSSQLFMDVHRSVDQDLCILWLQMYCFLCDSLPFQKMLSIPCTLIWLYNSIRVCTQIGQWNRSPLYDVRLERTMSEFELRCGQLKYKMAPCLGSVFGNEFFWSCLDLRIAACFGQVGLVARPMPGTITALQVNIDPIGTLDDPGDDSWWAGVEPGRVCLSHALLWLTVSLSGGNIIQIYD